MLKLTRTAQARRQGGRRGFTLLELIAVVVVLGILAARAVPAFTYVSDKVKMRVTVAEAIALAREGMDIALLDGREYIMTPDFGSNDFNRFTAANQPASGSTPWPYTSKHDLTVYIHDDGTVTSDVTGSDVLGRAFGGFNSSAAPSSSPTNSNTTVLSNTTLDGSQSLAGTGVWRDNVGKVTITRNLLGVQLQFDQANWEYVEVTMASVDTLYKNSGPDVVGVITKNSNTDVLVALSPLDTFSVRVKFNGGSSGMEYSFTSNA